MDWEKVVENWLWRSANHILSDPPYKKFPEHERNLGNHVVKSNWWITLGGLHAPVQSWTQAQDVWYWSQDGEINHFGVRITLCYKNTNCGLFLTKTLMLSKITTAAITLSVAWRRFWYLVKHWWVASWRLYQTRGLIQNRSFSWVSSE